MHLCLDQSLTPPSYSCGSALKQSEQVVEELDLQEILNAFAKLKNYESALDCALCSLYPELEQECRNYYNGKGGKLIDLHSKKYIKKVDGIVMAALVFFHCSYQKDQGVGEL